MNRWNRKSILNKEDGGITIDFLFAIVLVGGFSALLFSLSLTLTTSSIVQYMTFAAARNLNASHHRSGLQAQNALEKFNSLKETPAFAPLFQGNWFELKDEAVHGRVGDLAQYRPQFNYEGQAPEQRDLFVGFAVTFFARMLDFNVPFFGSTTDEGDGRGEGFRTEIGSFLNKEPSAEQCEWFNTQRWRAIRRLNVPGGVADYSQYTNDGDYVTMGDNGC